MKLLNIALVMLCLTTYRVSAETVTVAVPIESLEFRVTSSCNDTGNEESAYFVFKKSFDTDQESLVRFYMRAYKIAFNKFASQFETPVQFDQIFTLTTNPYWKILNPGVLIDFTLARDNYDFKKECANLKKLTQNSTSTLHLTLSINKGPVGYDCAGKCYQRYNANLESLLTTILSNGRTESNGITSYLSPGSVSLPVSANFCAGETVPTCGGTWD